MSSRRAHRVRVVQVAGERRATRPDAVAVEEPLEIRVAGSAYMTTLRTPGHDIELAHGMLASEGIIDGPDGVATMRYCAGSVTDDDGVAANTYNVLDVAVAPGVVVADDRRRASLTTASGLGCGMASIELLRRRPAFDVASDPFTVPAATISALPGRLREAQRLFATTGGLQAAGLFDAEGRAVVVREDVGRRNVVDKVLGWALLNGRRPAAGTVLFVSGRTSVELAQKAVLAGVPVLAGVSAPSSLAVEVAVEFGMTLVGLVRDDRMTIYARPDRIT